MREYKFRAWDKEVDKMIYSNETYPRSSYKFEFEIFNDYKFTLSKIFERFNVVGEEGEDYYIENYEVVDAEIMQYTELKDRNGTEIYEGDILKIQRVTLGEEFEIESVAYDKYEGMYLAGIYRLGRIDHRAEVIGNIYDNTELLG